MKPLFQYPETAAVIFMIGVSLFLACYSYSRRRHLFDPRFFFPLFYCFVTVSPCLNFLLLGGNYNRGVRLDVLPEVLCSCTSAIVAFHVGVTLSMGRLSKVKFGISKSLPLKITRPEAHEAALLVKTMAFVGSGITIIVFAYCISEVFASQPEGGGVSKSQFFLYVDESTMRMLHFSSALASALLVIFVLSDALTQKDAISWPGLVLLPTFSLLCILNGEREFILVCGIWVAANYHKLSRVVLISLLIALLIFLGLVPIIRREGLGANNIIAGLKKSDSRLFTESLMVLSPNLLIFTNVVTIVPDQEKYWLGRSPMNALISFSPVASESVDYTPTYWFADVYEYQGTSGYAFSQDAEAYLNFGYVGVPFWYVLWGVFIGYTYRRAFQPTADLADIFLWWQSAMAFMFAIRADIRTPLKIIVFGYIATHLMLFIARLLLSNRTSRLG